jgi:hypothetical protein
MFFEVTILTIAFTGALLALNLMRLFGRGAMGIAFLFFSAGVFILGLSLLFLFLCDNHIFFHLEDVNMHIWVHVLVFLGLLLFAIGGKKLNDLSHNIGVRPNLSGGEQILLGSSLLFSLTVFFFAPSLDAALAPITVNSVVDTLGLHHFIAFMMAIICAVYIWSVRASWGKMLGVGVAPFLAFLFLIGMQHLWEAMTESWKLFSISSQQIELVEQFLLFPAYTMLAIAFFRIIYSLSPSKQ